MPSEELNFRIKATDEASSTFAQVAANARKAAQQAESAGFEGAVEKLKANFGRQSGITEALHIAGGAGPVIGLGLAAREMKEYSERVIEVQKLMREGAGGGEIALALGRAVPILGDIIDAGKAARELMTGEQQQINDLNRAAELANHFAEFRLNLLRQQNEAHVEQLKHIREINDAAARAHVPGAAGQFLGLEQQAGALRADAPHALIKIRDTVREKYAAKLKEAQDEKIAANIAIEANRTSFERITGSSITSKGEKQAATDIFNELQARGHQAEKQIGAITKQQNEEITQQQKDFREANKAELEKNSNELSRLMWEAGEQRRKDTASIEQQIADTKSEAMQKSLTTAGQFYKADLEAIQRNLADKNRAVDESYAKQMQDIGDRAKAGRFPSWEASNAEIDKLNAQTKQRKDANQKEADAETAGAGKSDAVRIAEQEVSLARAQAAAVQDQVAAGDKAKEIDEARLKIHEQFVQRAKELKDLAASSTGDMKKQFDDLAAKLGPTEAAAQQRRTGTDLQQMALTGLAGAGPLGERMAEKFRIQQEFEERRKHLKGILDDPTATPEQKKQAESLMGTLGGQEQSAVAHAMNAGVQFSAFAGMHQNQGGITGIGMAAQESAFLRKSDGEAKIAGLLNQILSAIHQSVDKMVNETPTHGSVFGSR